MRENVEKRRKTSKISEFQQNKKPRAFIDEKLKQKFINKIEVELTIDFFAWNSYKNRLKTKDTVKKAAYKFTNFNQFT